MDNTRTIFCLASAIGLFIYLYKPLRKDFREFYINEEMPVGKVKKLNLFFIIALTSFSAVINILLYHFLVWHYD